MKNEQPVIVFDFDGVIAKSTVNEVRADIGEPNANVILVMRMLKTEGWAVHIWTGRKDTIELREWLDSHYIPYDSINSTAHNPAGYSNKPFYDIYVDDRAVSYNNQIASTLMQNIKNLLEFNKRRDGEV